MTKHTPTECLASITITSSHFEDCDSLDEEFKVIKKIYHEKILREHPDKGGDPATFRETRAAFEVLRSLYQEGSVNDGSFGSYLGKDVEEDFPDIDELYETYASSAAYPSYRYYEEAAATVTPGYRVEKSKSNRSVCKSKTGKVTCGGKIQRDEIRVGSLDKDSGGYGRWHHLQSAEERGTNETCKGWRVPKKVWQGLISPTDPEQSLKDLLCMEDILLCGLAGLDGASQRIFAAHCMDEDNWASHKRKAIEGADEVEKKKGKKSKKTEVVEARVLVAASSEDDSKPSADEVKPAAEALSGFALPSPDSLSTVDADFLKNHVFLISGSFPELTLGSSKAKDAGLGDVKVLIESFGGKIAARFSKKTSYLIVGKDPNRSKFIDAETREIPLLSLNMLISVLNQGHTFASVESLPALVVESFEGAAYKVGGGVVPPVDPAAAASAAGSEGYALAAKKKAAKKKAAKKATEAKEKPAKKAASKEKKPKAKKEKVKIPNDTASVLRAALAAQAAGRTAPRAIESGASRSAASSAIVPAAAASTSTAVAAGGKARFVIPRPGRDGIAGVLAGKKFVLTGLFPEVGGGSGLNLGKDRMIQMIESFGGQVTSSVSGKTNYVVIGREPGQSKVGKAHQRNIPLLDIMSLQRLLLGQANFETIANEAPPAIESFSSGYGGNALFLRNE